MKRLSIYFFIICLMSIPMSNPSLANDYTLKGSKKSSYHEDSYSKRVERKKLEEKAKDEKANVVLVEYRNKESVSKALGSLASKNIKSRRKIGSKIEVLTAKSAAELENLISELKKDPSILYVEKNNIRELQSLPNDPYASEQWSLLNIMADEGWSAAVRYSSGGRTVKVGVIDSGIDTANEDLVSRIGPGGYNFCTSSIDMYDLLGHGTKVSAIIAAQTNNNIGIAGITGEAGVEIIPLKAVYDDGTAYSSDIIDAIYYAIQQKVDVINLSIGYYTSSSLENSAIQEAIQKGIVVVAAIGNHGENQGPYATRYLYPACYDNVIAVASINENNSRSTFSAYNDKVDFAAPGEHILSYGINNQLSYGDGTSFSTPVVSGIAAILKSLSPEITPGQVENILHKSSIDLGTAGRDNYYGYGKVNLYNAVKTILPPPAPTNPVVDDIYNKFGWTYVDGFTKASNYEYTIDNGSTWDSCSSNPQKFPDGDYEAGAVQVRVKADSSIPRPAGYPLPASAGYTKTPLVSFSFDGPDAGMLMNSKTYMEYSLNGGGTHLSVTQYDILLPFDQLAKVNYSSNIKVRIKASASDPAGPYQTIDILQGPPPPSVTADDAANTVIGIDSTMEFTLDNGITWTRYTGPDSLGDMRGTFTMKVRKFASGTTLAGNTVSLNFKSNNPALLLNAVLDSSCCEAHEDTSLITVTLTNGEFISLITPNDITLSGLPQGITKGDVQFIDPDTFTVQLSGNSTVDYDSDIKATISVGKDAVVPLQPSPMSTYIMLKATKEPTPAAPAISFSFDGENAGKLMGSTKDMEYSINNGTTYLPVEQNDLLLSKEQISAINAADNIRIRVKATLRYPAGSNKVIDILAGPSAPVITGDDAANTVSGLNTYMEISKDNGATWIRYVDASSLGDMSGTFTLTVRKYARSVYLAGEAASLEFTSSSFTPL